MQKKDGPFYKQIKDYLEDIIIKNQNNRQFKLPSENQIALKFNSSRIPVRRALEELVNEDKVYRVQGKGTFICQNKLLRRQNEKSVCLFIPGFGTNFSTQIANGVQRFFYSVDVSLYIVITNDDTRLEEKMIDSALEKNFDGFLIYPGVYHSYNDALLRLVLARFPTVLLGRELPGLNISSVCSDHYGQTYDAVKYLLNAGHRRIGFIAECASAAAAYVERINGYRDCITANLSQNDLHLLEIDFFSSERDPQKSILEKIENFLNTDTPVTALITTSMALECLYTYMSSRDMDTGKLHIITLDDPGYIRNLFKNLEMINQQPEEIGYNAASLLYNHISEDITTRKIAIEHKILRK